MIYFIIVFGFLLVSVNTYAANKVITIDRGLEEIALGQSFEAVLQSGKWRELTGSELTMFKSGIPEERMLVKENGTMTICGFTRGILYKVAIILSAADGRKYLDKFTSLYGSPSRPTNNWSIWEDNHTGLELSFRGVQANIMLTDKGVFSAGK